MHDEDTQEPHCLDQQYIMSRVGGNVENLNFSRCSLMNMTKQLNSVIIIISYLKVNKHSNISVTITLNKCYFFV